MRLRRRRESFSGTGPWKVFAGGNYDQDVVVGLAPERRINNGQPVLHAINLAALNVKQGEKVLHVGAGTGYYTAVLARLTGATGTVVAYEVEHDLALNAIQNLSDFSNVTVQERSGSEAPLPVGDAIYVNAGATAPLDVWLDAPQLNGRLLFPLTPADATTSFDATVAVPGEIYSRALNSLPHRNWCSVDAFSETRQTEWFLSARATRHSELGSTADNFSHTDRRRGSRIARRELALLVRARRPAAVPLHNPAPGAREFALTVFVPVAANAHRRAPAKRWIVR